MKQYILVFTILVFILGAIWMRICKMDSNQDNMATKEVLPDKIEFRYHIRPILSDKCYTCHGPDVGQRKAGLRLDIEEEAFTELKENPGKFALVPGNHAESQLYVRITSENSSEMMPPAESNLVLTDYEKKILEKWIDQGAEYQDHWAFMPPQKNDPPSVQNNDWIKNEIDYHILNKIEEVGLTPSPQASRAQLIRRLSLDLTGLPPDYEEVIDFINNDNPDAYKEIVDKLLDSPHYGERMAQIWLDIARYADSHGYQDDSYRTMWPWRDWVIHAFNQNMPYNEFIRLQIAGDLLPDPTKEQLLATGFNRNHPITQEGGVIDEEYRVAYVSDRTNTLGKGILGITLECARCHDHKYDPFSQKEYYSMYSFFNNVSEKGLQYDAPQAAARKYYADAPFVSITDEDAQGILSYINKQDTGTVNVMVMNDSISRETFLLARGNYDAHSTPVSPGTPEAIMKFSTNFKPNRMGLADWVTSNENPLTARVFVNRLWIMLFGQGIVKTAEDFGSQGSLPSHPELLDWLAADFIENDWDIKAIVKKIVLSATYQQKSSISPELYEKDPENILLARGPRFRMSAEMIRDYMLKTSGLLNNEIGGPSVKPYQPQGLWEETNAGNGRGILTSYVADKDEKLYRRSLYTFWKRTLPPPSMTIFDAPNRDICEVRRQVTNTPLQALAIQNDIQSLEAARVLAQDISLQLENEQDMVENTFNRILMRDPGKAELKTLKRYYQNILMDFEKQPEKAESLVDIGSFKKPETDLPKTAALMMVAQVLYNLDETITKE